MRKSKQGAEKNMAMDVRVCLFKGTKITSLVEMDNTSESLTEKKLCISHHRAKLRCHEVFRTENQLRKSIRW